MCIYIYRQWVLQRFGDASDWDNEIKTIENLLEVSNIYCSHLLLYLLLPLSYFCNNLFISLIG